MGIITPVVRSSTFLLLFFELLISHFQAPAHESKSIQLSGIQTGAHVQVAAVFPMKKVVSPDYFSINFFSGGGLEDIAISSTITNIYCNGGSTGAISVSAEGGTPPYSYSWTGQGFTGSSSSVENLSAGSYLFIVTDSENKTISEEFTLTEPERIDFSLSATPAICYNMSNGAIAVSNITGGTGTYTLSLNEGSYSSFTTFNDLPAGSHKITVKDGNGCTQSQSIEVTEPGVLAFEPGQFTSVSCNGGNNGSVTAGIVSGGTGEYTYSLNHGNFQDSRTFNGLNAGNYTITAKDAKGCTVDQIIVVTQPDELIILQGQATPVSCNGGSDGSVTAGSVSGGIEGYTFSLNNGDFQNTSTFSGLTAGSYTITVKDANGCTVNQTIVVTQPEVLAIQPGQSTPVSCYGGSDGSLTAGIVSGGTEEYSYSLNNGTYQTSNIFDGLVAGDYTITVKDVKGCTKSQSIKVNQPAPLTLQMGQFTPVSCHGGSDGTVTAGSVSGGNGTYTYSINAVDFQVSNKFSGLGAGSHTLTVKDAKGCTATQLIQVPEPDPLVLQPSDLSPVSCNGGNDGSITIKSVTGGNGGYRYSLNGSQFSTNKTYVGLAAGEYIVRVRDEKNCIVSETISITEPGELAMTPPSGTAVTCFGGDDGIITAGTVSGGVPPYQYSIDNTTFQSNGNFIGVKAGRQSILVVDANNCAFETPIVIDQPDQITASIKKTDVKCNGGSDGEIRITNISGGSGDYEFSVDGINWTSSSVAITSLAVGNYTIEVRDANEIGCIVNVGTTTLDQPAPLTAEYTTTRTTTYGSSSGSATANPTGGTGIYSYIWTKVGNSDIIQTTKTANNLLAGTYSVTIKDSNGCLFTIDNIEVADKITAEINAISLCEDITGEGLRTSTFSVDLPTVLGGVGEPEDFTYSWDFGSDVESTTVTSEGTKVEYKVGGDKIITLTIKDGDDVLTVLQFPHYVGQCFENCGQSQNFKIDSKSFYIGDEAGNPVTGDNCASSAKKYLWFNILQNSNAYALNTEIKYSVNDSEGTHKRIVMGCSGTKVEIPKENGNGSSKFEYTLLPLGKYKLFEVSETPTSDNSKIQWSCGQSFTIEGMTMRFVTNAGKECGDTGNMQCIGVSDNQEVSTPIIATASGEAVICKGEALGSISFSVKGGIPSYQYSINGNVELEYQNSGIFVNLLAGTYNDLWVRDSRGNTYHLPDPVIISEPAQFLDATPEIVSPIICHGGTAEVGVTASGGTAPYTYLWNDEAGTTLKEISGLPPGIYTVTVIDVNGCQIIKSVPITEPAPLTLAETGPAQHLNCGFNSTFLQANTPSADPERGETGTWSLIDFSPSTIATDRIIFSESDPDTKFSAPKGTYTLRWTISNEAGTCSNYSEMTVQFDGNCEQLDFDGIDDYILVGDFYDFPSSSFSLEAWVKPEAVDGNRTVLSKGNWRDPGAGGYELLINNEAFTFRWNNNSVTTSHKIRTDRWYHLAVVFSGARVDLYVDGIPVGNRTVTTPPQDVAEPFLIGGMYDASKPEKPESLFHGWIEEIRIWQTALTIEQIRFMMNQRIEPVSSDGISYVKGEMLPMNVPGSLTWNTLKGYYRLLAQAELIEDGTTPNLASDSAEGFLRNIESFQINSAPLPYISETNGEWNDRTTWDQQIGTDSEKWWEYPNSTGINGAAINWNIAFVNDELTSNNTDINLLALVIGGSLEMEGINPVWTGEALTQGTGNGLTITRYLELNGLIDLNGESQLVQPEGSILEGSGTLERDQQGTASSYNYNYWTSPVSTTISNSGYTIQEVMKDGTNIGKHEPIIFNYQYHHADGAKSTPIKISTYWLNKFFGESGMYSQWRHVGHQGTLQAGEGFSMKGSSGYSKIEELQNYTFTGFPNNGTIKLNIGEGQSYLIGNPYPSAIDGYQFILDNISESGGNNSQNIFNGTLYFWDHFSGQTHYLQEYIGGYAIFNLSGGVRAIANDSRINNETPDGDFRTGEKIPQRYIPVGQAFFVNTKLDDAITSSEIPVTVHGGDITFKNSQRVFMKEGMESSVFHSQEPVQKKEKDDVDKRKKIWLKFTSPTGYHRQLLVTADTKASNNYDLGFDALLIENNAEDMYWFFSEVEFIIQGVPHLNRDQVLPLGIKVKKNTKFTIRIDDLENISDDMEIYLKDKQLKLLHDLRESDYKATAEPGTINDRFELVFQAEDSKPGVPDGGSEEGGEDGGDGDETGESETPEPDNNGIALPNELEVFYVQENREILIRNPHLLKLNNAYLNNTLGQQIQEYREIFEAQETTLPVKEFGAGVYIITINSEKGVIVRKIIIE